tara:strand:- start:63 stop:251 length:189 start_codon:yes stop_codon:yes gene_type:complete
MKNLRDEIQNRIVEIRTRGGFKCEEEDMQMILNEIKAMTDDELLKTYTAEIELQHEEHLGLI